MTASSDTAHSLLERGWALLFAASKDGPKRDDALRIAIAIVESDGLQLSAVALLTRLLLASGKKKSVAGAAARLVDAYVRRGDLAAATAAAVLVDRAGGDAVAARSTIAAAFGKGSARVKDVSPAPPPLPATPDVDGSLATLAGDALLAMGEQTLAAFRDAEDPVPHGPVPALPLFSALEPRALERLLAALTVRDLATDELAIRQGEEGREAFVVVRGVLRAERAAAVGAEDAAPTVLAALGPGAIFGEMALVSDAPRAASVIAQEPTTLLVVSREALETLAATAPVIGQELGAFCRARMIANLVRTSALLPSIPASDRAEVIARFDARTFREGEVLSEEGSEPSGLFLIASGGVRVAARDPGGDDVVVADLGPGDVVGEISIVLRRPATATVTASYPTVALELSREKFHDAIRAHPAVLTELYQLATTRQDELHSVVAQEALDVTEVVLL